jgi:hypothetical protein
LVRNHAEGVEVDAMIDSAVARDLLRCHVERSPDSHARRRGALIDDVRRAITLCRRHQRLRDAKVRHDDTIAFEQNVVRLEIAVNHTVGVRVAERIGDCARATHDVGNLEAPNAPEASAKCFAVDKRHRVPQSSGAFPASSTETMPGCCNRLASSISRRKRFAARSPSVGRNTLSADVPLPHDVARAKHDGHAPSANFTVKYIAVGERRRELIVALAVFPEERVALACGCARKGSSCANRSHAMSIARKLDRADSASSPQAANR